MKVFYIVIALVFCHISTFSKEIGQKGGIYKHINSDQGLSQSVVTSIAQDRTGFMWFGTLNGINRFDGVHFKQYKMSDSPGLLRSFFILSLLNDSRNNLWVATDKGVGIYDRKRDVFLDAQTVYAFPGQIGHLDQVETIYEDSRGFIWIASTTGLFKLDPHRLSAEHISPSFDAGMGSGLDFKIREIEEARPGVFYFASYNYLFEYRERGNFATKRAELYKRGSTKIADRIQHFCIDRKGTIWIGTMLGAGYKYLPAANKLIGLDLPASPLFNDLIVETDSSILLSLDVAGVIRYNTVTDDYEYLFDKNNPKMSIQGNKIRQLFISNQQILWLGHFQDGISFTGLTHSGFHLVSSLVINSKRVALNSVSALLKDRTGTLWIATDGKGLFAVDKHGKARSYVNHPSSSKSLPSDAVLSLFEDRDGDIWIGSYRGGLTHYNRTTDDFTSYSSDPLSVTSLKSNDIRSIKEDRHGRLWLSAHGAGFSMFDKKSGLFTNFIQKDGDSLYLLNNWTYTTVPDQRGNIWISAAQGMSVYDTANKKMSIFFQGDPKTRVVSESFVYTAFCDSKGRMWAGTDKGLCAYNYQDGSFKLIAGMNSLPEETIYSIVEDLSGLLWVGTNVGLFRYDPKTNVALKFTVHDGLQADEFITNSVYRDRDGILYFGGVNGFNYFLPDRIDINRTPPTIALTDIELMGVSMPAKLLDSKKITLRHNQNFLTFRFVALNFIASEKNRYKFKLLGLDTDWQDAGHDGKAVYTSLPPGEYTFMAIGANNDGVWNLKGTQFQITILAPWWATWWFRALATILIIGSISGYYFFKIRDVRMRNSILELKVAARTVDLRKANEDLEEKNTLIEAKNEELHRRNVEIKEQNLLLIEKQEEIEQQHYNLQIQKEEIQTVNEELTTINNQLADHEAQLIETNEQLKQLVNTKDKMLSIIAHDLKNPMNTLIGFSSIIMGRTQTYDPQKLEKFIGLINQAAVNSYKLLENLLTWARSQTGNIKLEIVPQDILPILTEDITFLKETAEKKDITIELQVLVNPDSHAKVDANTVSTIFRNLLSNAIKFTKHQGNISIIVADSMQDAMISVSVIDNGVGMTESQLSRLFRVENNNSTHGTDREIGTGLGLVICKEFVEMNSGRIEVASTPGQGTTFQVFFPKAD